MKTSINYKYGNACLLAPYDFRSVILKAYSYAIPYPLILWVATANY